MADFLGMMKQAAQLQSKMQAMQEELGSVEVEGVSGGGLVSVRMTAKMEVKAVKIDPSLMKADEREILEDLLVTALGDARREQAQHVLRPLVAGMSGNRRGFGIDCAARCGRWRAAQTANRRGRATVSSTAMRTATPLRTWARITDCGPSATSEEISMPRFMGPGCMTIASALASFKRGAVSPKRAKYSAPSGIDASSMRSFWMRSIITTSACASPSSGA